MGNVVGATTGDFDGAPGTTVGAGTGTAVGGTPVGDEVGLALGEPTIYVTFGGDNVRVGAKATMGPAEGLVLLLAVAGGVLVMVTLVIVVMVV